MTDRKAVQRVLLALPHSQRSATVKESLQAALDRLPDDESRRLARAAERLAGAVNKLGAATALEVLAAIGQLWSENGHEP